VDPGRHCNNYSVWLNRYPKYLTAVAAAGLAGSLLVASQADAAIVHPQRHYQRAHAAPPLDWAVDIPRIGVAAPVIRLGGPRSGAIAVPTFAQVGDVGWYRYGAVPGQRGNAVFLGHVDTYQGPAVFYDLYELRPGDQVEVDLGHHDTQRFTVHWVKEVLKTRFPASKVFGGTDGRHLWLVTCGGQFDYYTRSYLSNIVVYTTADARHVRRVHHHHAPPVPAGGAVRHAKNGDAGKAADTSGVTAADQPGSVASAATAALMRSGRLTPPLVFSTQR
jgi:hypothetical protein